MVEFLYNYDAEIVKFVAQLNGRTGPDFGKHKTIGVLDSDGRLCAGIVYFNFDDQSETIEMAVAAVSPAWATRTTMKRAFEYPFIECGCQMVVSRIKTDNERWLACLARMNFNFVLIPRMFGRDEDGVLATLTDDAWLDSKFSKHMYRDVRKAEAAA